MIPIRTLLVIEDNPGDTLLLREMFKDDGSHSTELTHANDMNEAEMYLFGNAFDIILCDLGLPDAQGLEVIRRAHAAAPNVPLVVLTGLDDEALAAQNAAGGCSRLSYQGSDRATRASARFAVCDRA
jgi:CheY-like chemotaxis protein